MNAYTFENLSPKCMSIINQFELVKLVITNPDAVDKEILINLHAALGSQSAFAAFNCFSLSIVGMSINTHKLVADKTITGGYSALDECRKSALTKSKKLLEKSDRVKRRTVDWYKTKLEEKDHTINLRADEIALMSLELDEVLQLGLDMAKECGRTEEFQKRQQELFRKFKKDFGRGNPK